MEDIESGEAHSEEKALPETNKKRQFKTPSQVQALEEFYNEQKYPTDSMKAELAEKLGLTEKQISGWFCHRRLKDRRMLTEETHGTGRQDLSSGFMQDRGSWLRQDSCGSTKRGDYKLAELREVESRRFRGEDLPPSELHYGQREHYGMSEMDDTSSESNSDLHEGLSSRGRDVMDMEPSPYGMPNGFIPQSRGRAGPSGYLKIKGQIENVAITALKRQLGRHYRDDGPPLGVDFDPLPPDAFESLSRNAVHEPYKAAERNFPIPLDVCGARWPLSPKSDMYVDAAKSKQSHSSDQHALPLHRPLKKKLNDGNAGLSEKPSFSADEYSAEEASVYDGIKNSNVRSKHAVEGMKPDPFSNFHFRPSAGKITSEQAEPWPHNHDDINLKASRKRAGIESKPSSLKSQYKDSLDKRPDELCGEKRTMREHQDPVLSKCLMTEMKTSKRGRGFLQQDFVAKPAFQELPPVTKQIRGSAMEMPSSFSEYETAETSSVD